jgi:hypothetical protein
LRSIIKPTLPWVFTDSAALWENGCIWQLAWERLTCDHPMVDVVYPPDRVVLPGRNATMTNSTRGPIAALVVDNAERPSAN